MGLIISACTSNLIKLEINLKINTYETLYEYHHHCTSNVHITPIKCTVKWGRKDGHVSYGLEMFFVTFFEKHFCFLWLYSPIQALAASINLSVSFQWLELGQSAGLLGQVISLSQGLYLYTNTEKRTHKTHTKYPCSELDSNSRSRRPSERRQFMA
jgi:hypothetical protein